MDPLAGLVAAAAFAVGGVGGFWLVQRRERARREIEKAAAQDEASRILTGSKQEAESLLKSAELRGKEDAFRLRESWEKEEARRREELERVERRAEERSSALDSRHSHLDEREVALERRAEEMSGREATMAERETKAAAAEQEALLQIERSPAFPSAKPATSFSTAWRVKPGPTRRIPCERFGKKRREPASERHAR